MQTHLMGKKVLHTTETQPNINAGTLNAGRLSHSGVSAPTYGDANSVSQIAVDIYGRVTSASSVDISTTGSQVSDLESVVEGLFSATDSGGLGSFSAIQWSLYLI